MSNNFLGGSEMFLRTEILNLNNKVQRASVEAKKVNNSDNSKYMEQLKKVAKDFESIFLSYMLKQMRKTVPDNPLFGKSIAKDIFYDMQDDAIGKELAKAGGIGLAAIIYKQLSTIEGTKKNIDIKK